MRKKTLLVFFGLSLVIAGLEIYASRQVRATPDERARTLAGDDLIPQPIGSVNHAISIHRPPRDVWPWLVQMGSNRAGWYAYDFIDNWGHASAERILPGYQEIRVGTVFPALQQRETCLSLHSAIPNAAWFSPGVYPTASIRPLGRLFSINPSLAKHA